MELKAMLSTEVVEQLENSVEEAELRRNMAKMPYNLLTIQLECGRVLRVASKLMPTIQGKVLCLDCDFWDGIIYVQTSPNKIELPIRER